jgi:hypothetical protein
VLDFHVQLRVVSQRGATLSDVAAVDGVAVLDAVPLDRVLAYRALAEGRRSAWGEFTAVADGARSIGVQLAPGWSTEVFVTSDAGAGLAGVRVSFDDVLAGVTDEHGALRVSLERHPQSARFELDGWTAGDASDYSAATGRFRSWLPWLSIAMQRAK